VLLGLKDKVEILEMLQVLIEEQNEEAICLIRGFGFFVEWCSLEDLENVRQKWQEEMGQDWNLIIKMTNVEGMYHVMPTQSILVMA
jgi:hypothetical protein